MIAVLASSPLSPLPSSLGRGGAVSLSLVFRVSSLVATSRLGRLQPSSVAAKQFAVIARGAKPIFLSVEFRNLHIIAIAFVRRLSFGRKEYS